MTEGRAGGRGDGGPKGHGPIKVEFLHEMPEDPPGKRKGVARKAKRAEMSARARELVFMLVVAAVMAVFFMWVLKDVLYRLIALVGLVAAILFNVRRILLRSSDV